MTTIGVDIGGTNIRAAVISAEGEILDRRATRSDPDPETALARISDLIQWLEQPCVRAIGLGVPGRVDSPGRRVLSGGYLDLSRIAVADRLEQATGRPVAIDNDCSMALRAEMATGRASGHRNVAMLTIGTGIGGAVAVNGEILRGQATAGQLGHLTIDVNGRPCVCGRRGCVETESSGTALRRHIEEAGLPADTTADHLFAAADKGDATAIGVLTRWAVPLRAAIETLSATLDPELILLGGGLGHYAERALAFAPSRGQWISPAIAAAALGDDAGVIGAGLAARSLETGRNRAAPSKQVILVNGIPASGKSGLSRALSDRTGWTLLTLDTIKNPFLVELGGADRAFNRTLGKASYEAIWSVIRDAPAGTTFIIDAWFGFQPLELLDSHAAMAGVTAMAEFWCHAPAEVLAERYAARLSDRPAGHPGAAYIPELVALAARATPTGRAPMFAVDTTRPVDVDAATAWARQTLATASRPAEHLG